MTQPAEPGSGTEGGEGEPTPNIILSESNHSAPTVTAQGPPGGGCPSGAANSRATGDALADSGTTPATSPAGPQRDDDSPSLSPQLVVAPANIPSYSTAPPPTSSETRGDTQQESSVTGAKEPAHEENQGQGAESSAPKAGKQQSGAKTARRGGGEAKRARGGGSGGGRGGKGGKARTWSQRDDGQSPSDSRKEGADEGAGPKRSKRDRKPVKK